MQYDSRKRWLLLWVKCCLFACAGATATSSRCAPSNCPATSDSFYNVHLVPHSHMDLGWLKTVDQYFFGTRANITSVAVQYIYDSVVHALAQDPRRRFMFVETGFFEMWWKHRGLNFRNLFRRLVMNGQIEFVSGGYVMNDEAASYYMNTIDQMTYGLTMLKELFGECGISRVGWQIDPFGHSREFASILAQMGYQGIFLGRIDYLDKKVREASQQMEFMWRVSSSLPQLSLKGVVLPNTYSPPPGFCFDEFCDDEVIVEDPDSVEYNGPKRATELLKWLQVKANFYSTNNLLITMGEDFNYQNAHKWISNLEALMRLINGKGYKIHGLPVRLVYSTPSCYLAAIQRQNQSVAKTDDFFPYASDPHAYWTGYFTSRPAFKYFDRFANSRFQTVKQLGAMAGLQANCTAKLRRALAIAQHHDAITGTAKQHVNDDYTRMLSIGLDESEEVLRTALYALAEQTLPRWEGAWPFFCRGLNVSECDDIEATLEANGNLSVLVYNPLSQPVNYTVRIPIVEINNVAAAVVHGPTDRREDHFDLFPISEGVKRLAERKGHATHEIILPLQVGPLSFAMAVLERRKREGKQPVQPHRLLDGSIERGGTTVRVESGKGVVFLSTQHGAASIPVDAGYFFYPTFVGNNTKADFRAGGAYIFRPASETARKLLLTNMTTYVGSTMTEIRSEYGHGIVYETIRINNAGEIEIDWIVGPIPIDDGVGKEIIWRWATNISSGDSFTTDANGRESLERRKRPTTESIAGNYYPVTSRISISDATRTLAVLVDRSQAGSSLRPGEIELMLHRRCLHDDGFGVEEALNETGADGHGLQVRGTYRLQLLSNNQPDSASQRPPHRADELSLAMRPLLAFVAGKAALPHQSLVRPAALPRGIHLLSLERVADKDYLVRLENIYERDESSQNITVDLHALFKDHGLINIRETLLATNIDLKPSLPQKPSKQSQFARLMFDGQPDRRPPFLLPHLKSLQASLLSTTIVTLSPMQIRTFIVTLGASAPSL